VTIERLAKAVRASDAEQVRAILRVRAELVNGEVPGTRGLTSLHCAVLGRLREVAGC
jgi:hypothetical protein